MLRQVLKSKIHRAVATDANLEYEGSIDIPRDMMELVDLWPGEKVLVVSLENGARLETYVQEGEPGTGKFTINGAAAHLIQKGHRIIIMAFALTDKPIVRKRIVLNEKNEIIG
jgi:aspartate 1-decarboxylase